MRYIWQHIKIIIDLYDGSLPLAHFLKNYFKQHPILGSRDRNILNAMAYSWYRCGKGIRNSELGIGIETQVMICLRICKIELPSILPVSEHSAGSPDDETPFDLNKLFLFDIEFSEGINRAEWLDSMLIQPDLFIRITKDKGKIISLLNSKQIPFTFIPSAPGIDCLALPNGAKIDQLLPPDTYAVQDASSQKTGEFFHPKKNELWYDCCSGAGGKSLLLKDLEPGVRLTVSDVRESIIRNLQERFRLYRHVLPVVHVTDVADKIKLDKSLINKQFDNIICDAPCSGSGTWARTPEQLYFFDPATLDKFSNLQKTIAINVAGHLKPGGRLLYITCSIFKRENEDVVDEVVKQTGMQVLSAQVINGVSIHADSMFVAVLQK
jgi:16S rRNA (cytosine967-C5)-methyltransferase